MGINTVQNTSIQEARLPATSEIASGDLVVLNEGGTTAKASNQLTISQHNITTAGLSALSALANKAPNTNYTFVNNESEFNAVILGSGVIATAYSGNGTTNTTGVNVSFLTITGAVYAPSINVTTSTSVTSIKIIKLNDSKFVVAYMLSQVLYFRVYNNDGTAVSASVTVGTVASPITVVSDYAIARINNTRFVMSYNLSSTARFKIFDDTGTIVGTETTIDSGSCGMFNILTHSTTGDFWIFYYFPTGPVHKFSRYNSSGVLQGTNTTINTGGAYPNTNLPATVTELSDGKVAVFSGNANQAPNLYLYTSAGALSASNTTWHGNASATALFAAVPRIVPQANGEFYLFNHTSGNTIKINKFNNSLNVISTITTTGLSVVTTGTSIGYLFAFVNGSAGFTIVSGGYTGTNYGANIFSISSTGALIGTNLALWVAQGNMQGGTAFVTPEGVLVFFGSAASPAAINMGIYHTQKKSLFGVAQDTVATGANYRAATQGTFQLNSSTIPSSPGLFDNRAVNPPGPKGIIAGTTAILYGME
jgi:hypothetical protein